MPSPADLLDFAAVGQPSLVAGPVFKTGEGQRELSLASSIPVLYRHFLSSLLQLALRAGYRGQIRGWDTPDRDDPEPASSKWWLVSDEHERVATAWFIATAN
jgi:hypothetical protein